MDLKFEPEYIPDMGDCAALAASAKMPGNVIQLRILKSIVDGFLVELRNANTEDASQCVERVRRSQVAVEIYQTMIDRINQCVQMYGIQILAGDDTPAPDMTEESLQMDYATDVDNLVNYFDFEESQI